MAYFAMDEIRPALTMPAAGRYRAPSTLALHEESFIFFPAGAFRRVPALCG
jgi:hypothetical protein